MSSLPEDFKAQFRQLACCVIIPTYNNGQKLADVVSSVLQYCADVVVVNDGSTDDTLAILAKYGSDIQLVSYTINQGKGVALRTGFRYAHERGYQYAITIDSDGQHFAEDLPKFLEKLETEKNAIVIGARNMDQASVPGKSSFGNRFSNFWFTLETGVKVPDTQSGYRLYPLAPLRQMTFITWRYEFEIEVLVRASWAGVHIDSVPVTVYYPPASERITHFRPFADFFRISVLNTIFCCMAFFWYIPKRWFMGLKKKGLKTIISEAFLNQDETAGQKAMAVAFGVFMGIFPIWGYQLVVGILLCKLLKINIPIFVVAANISIPPNIPWIIFLSLWLGARLYGLETIIPMSSSLSLETVQLHLKQYIAGSILLAIAGGILLGSISFVFFRQMERKR